MSKSIVPRLYDAVGNPDEWNSILEEFVATFGAVGASLFSGDEVQIELNHVFMSSVVARNIPEYIVKGYNQVDMQSYECVKDIGKQLAFESEQELYARASRAGYKQPEKIEEYRAWLKSIGIEERMISVLQSSPGSWSFMVLHSGETKIKASQSDCTELLGHIAKIIGMNRPFLLLSNRFNAVFEVINKFHLGVIVLDSKNRIVLTNTAAECMIEEADGIGKDVAGKLKGSVIDASVALVGTFDESGIHDRQSSVVKFTIPRTSGKTDYVAEMSLLSSRVLDSSLDYRLMVITDPERGDIVDLSGISCIFQFSNAEEEVAGKIVEGATYKEIAESRGVSPETIKAQVASVLRKAGCKNRTELVCLAHKSSIPVDQVH